MSLSAVQQHELNMYKTIADICRSHDIKFYALGGTLLGAIRHQGFIPWDDDIDIGILRPDYERFLQVVKDELPSNYEARTHRDGWDGYHPPFYYCKIRDTDTLVELTHTEKPFQTPLWLDVFPLDAMPSNGLRRTVHKYHLLYERMKIQFSMYEENVHQHRANRPLYERMLMKFREVTKFGSNWDTYDLYRHIEKTLCAYDCDNEDYIVNMFGAYKFNEMFPKSWLDNPIELPFEDTTIPGGSEYDKILTQMYGDYMVLPSEEQRAQHHCMTVISLGDRQEAEAE